MKKKWITKFLIIGGVLLAGGVAAASGLTSVPGSTDDPLVTKSYVDQLFSKATGLSPNTGGSNSSSAGLTKSEVEKLINDKVGNISNTPPSSSGGEWAAPTSGLVVEALEPGDKVIGSAGTEFIVRSGKVKAVAGQNGDGLPNVTSGKNIEGGQVVPANHLIMIPRSDERGLQITSDSKTAYIMINGAYQVIKK